ncbi:MAG: GTP cyclohydrolase II [Planctomycetes bacterium]|nr:GTP cyclohydrolase II [Planctomycetota bacterium]
MAFASINELIADLRAGKMIVVVDDPRRENEGDIAIAAERVTPEIIQFMARRAAGEICLALAPEMCRQLQLHPQTVINTTRRGTGFTVTIDAREGVTTGISARERAHTVATAIRADCRPEDLVRPGHVHPLRAREGGVLVRPGHTEAIVDLARLAGLRPAGVICEILREEDDEPARLPDLEKFAEKYKLKIGSIEDLIRFRREREKLITRIETSVPLPSRFSPSDKDDFRIHLYRCDVDGSEHLAITLGFSDPEPNGNFHKITEPIPVRVHSECLTGDVFGSMRCDCGAQLQTALQYIRDKGRGVLVYMRGHEGRGIGLAHKLKAYKLQDGGLDTVQANEALGFPPDMREYGIGAQILADLGVTRMQLLTNNPKKLAGLSAFGLEIVEQLPIEVAPNSRNIRYLKTKKEKMGHNFQHLDDAGQPPEKKAGS